MPIFLGLGDDVGTKIATSSAAIFHQHILPECGLELFGEEAASEVDGSTRRKGHDNADWARGKVRSLATSRGEGGKNEGSTPYYSSTADHPRISGSRHAPISAST